MNKYGAIRKVMLMVLLSILGSYCIGSDRHEVVQANSFDYAMESACNMVISVGNYCYKLWSELMSKAMNLLYKHDDQVVKIQFVDERVHGNNAYCTDGKPDCVYNEEFFNDTSITGELDEDPTTHYDWDTDPIKLVPSSGM